MKHLQICYIVDSLAEKIIGKFPSPNKDYAKQVFSDFVNDEKNRVHSDVLLVFSNQYTDEYETFDEVFSCIHGDNSIGVMEVLNVNNCDSAEKN